MRQLTQPVGTCHLIFVVANHFEPAWSERGMLDRATQRERVRQWCDQARAIGDAVRDADGMPFRHTYFYPAEQYDPDLLDQLAELQRDGYGEVEIHLHHGLDQPDTPAQLRQTLTTFRDTLAEQHQCLSRSDGVGLPMYAFVHGNLALGNSAGGQFCGVDSEMEILAETGCYADLTLPSAPDRSQVPKINAIYQSGRPLTEAVPHRSGSNVRVGRKPRLPLLLTGPLVLDWSRRSRSLALPVIDNGCLSAEYPLDERRLRRWHSARIGVCGRPEWVFIKLYCHGFFDADQPFTIGPALARFLKQVVQISNKTGEVKIHFVTAREAFNLVMAAADGLTGDPGLYRNYKLRLIMSVPKPATPAPIRLASEAV